MHACEIISARDDKNVERAAKKDSSILLYKNASTVRELFEVWVETYGKNFVSVDVLFGENTVAYQIGIAPLRKRDLREFSHGDKIVNCFEEILRHNNVSDKENAFNRLIALFICKLVDEITKSDDDEVEFQYKPGTDTYETLQDRLMRLHKRGMKDFMNEEIFYVEDDYAKKLFSQSLNASRREKAINELNETIRILKFYSNNDFSFKDVHNEELFLQNGKILVEVVQLFEKFRIVHNGRNQLLGDLFEQLLDKGFTQNEGQFFTPTPITHFIWACLPLHRFKSEKPKIIDYACGAGHFLTEGVKFLRRNDEAASTDWAKKHIFGIEKDYRLARVAKVSLYMNGAGDGNIIFGDGLEEYADRGIKNGTFDVLVANPPYSVKGFKAHLKLKNNTFKILEFLSNDATGIELLFVERIAQLLKPRGIAAVILPLSILTSGDNSYIAVRDQILQNYFLRAIVQFGKKTFGKTGTGTVVLFLEKFDEPPRRLSLIDDSVSEILSGMMSPDWEDGEIIIAYLDKINVPEHDYLAFAREERKLEEWKACEYFAQYLTDFLNSTEIKNRLESKSFKKSSTDEQAVELRRRFYEKIKAVEREKLTCFALVYKQTTFIVSAPTEDAKQKEFLGYDWSNRKGKEGIKITKYGGELFNPDNLSDPAFLNVLVRKAFDGEILKNVPEEIARYAVLKDIIDFSRTSFNRAIKLTPELKIHATNDYKKKKLGEIILVNPKSKIQVFEAKSNEDGVPFYTSGNAVYHHEDALVDGENIFLSTGGNAVAHFHDGQASYSTDVYSIKSKDESEVLTYFLFLILKNHEKEIDSKFFSGIGLRHLQKDEFNRLEIPLPPIEIQREILAKCNAADEDFARAKNEIESAKSKIGTIIKTASASEYERLENLLLPIKEIKNISKKLPENQIQNHGKFPVICQNSDSVISGYTDNDIAITHKPLLVFGDHTCSIKYIDFPFVRGADGTQVLKADEKRVHPKFLFHCISFAEIYNREKYERHFKYLKQVKIPIPARVEQERIIAEIEKLETQIAEASKIVDAHPARIQEILKEYL